MNEKTDLSGQVALITGGGRGIGRALAQGVAAAGGAVAVASRTERELAETVGLIEDASGDVAAFPADVSDPSAVERLVASVEQRLGPIDLLVNNAGVARPTGRDWEVDPDTWWRTIEVNVRGPYLCSRAVVPGMIARRRGRIVNVSSSSAYLAGPLMSCYGASKAALTHMTRSLAVATREYGISVFAYAPGLVRTAMTDYLERSPEVPGEVRDGFRAAFRTEGMAVPPERSAEGLLLLASGKADALTGRYLDVRWGLADLVRRAAEIERDDLYTLQIRGGPVLHSGPRNPLGRGRTEPGTTRR